VDPLTGDPLPAESPYQDVSVVRALFEAIDALGARPAKTSGVREVARPRNQGKPWSEADTNDLLRRFDSGADLGELARHFGRTRYGVQTRLIRLGKLDPGSEAAFLRVPTGR
jgi:hypothetical protein